MLPYVTAALSGAAIVISLLTAWLTLLRRGELRMTQPTVVFFGFDAPRHKEQSPLPKIYLRTLLFSTGKRGQMIESMHIKVIRDETSQNFNIWVYGEEKLSRGSGLFVGEQGIAMNHHFLMPPSGDTFTFAPGSYEVKLYVKLVGRLGSRLLWSEVLRIDRNSSDQMKAGRCGIYFDWGPDSQRYLMHLEEVQRISQPEKPFNALRGYEGSPPN